MSLDSRLKGSSPVQYAHEMLPSLAHKARQVVNYLIPFFERYDPQHDARQVLDDPAVLTTGISYGETVSYLYESYAANRLLWRFAQLADTTDRPISIAGIVIELIGMAAGGAPGFFANIGEETIEMTLKVPFFANLAKKGSQHKWKILKLLSIEAGTYAAPILGDVVDAGTNLYMDTAHTVIREYAKQRILEDKMMMATPTITAAPILPPSTNNLI